MAEHNEKHYKGEGGNLGAAFEHAWEAAKEQGASPGVYKVEIRIEAENPIRGYIVHIIPDN